MQKQHDPRRPWAVTTIGNDVAWAIREDPISIDPNQNGPQIIAELDPWVHESTARLMAAAPELLEVVEIAMLQDECTCEGGQPLCLRCLAYHAYQKSTGHGE